MRRLVAVLAHVVALAVGPPVASGQAQPEAPRVSRPDTTRSIVRRQVRGASPGGAFLRAVLVPGWGHASIGAYNRGAFYVAVESATAWALVKSRERVREASERAAFRESVVRAELAAQNRIDPDTVRAALATDTTLQELRGLEESRRQQREDWTALGIFFLFLSGADAYVSAHLHNFPQPIEVNAVPVGGGRMELSVSIRLPRRRGGGAPRRRPARRRYRAPPSRRR